jgi:AbrB family looped-hinge helix DNA binding protein
MTIPKKIREASGLAEGEIVTLIPLGNTILLAPRRLPLEEARRQIARILKASGTTAEQVLRGLRKARVDLYRETYGRKAG